MNTYVFFLLSLFCVNFSFSMDNLEPRAAGSLSNIETNNEEVARGFFNAVTFSTTAPKLTDTFCEHVISCAPPRVQQEIITLSDPQARQDYYTNAMVLHGPAGGGKSTLAKVIAQKIGVPFLTVNTELLFNEQRNCSMSQVSKLTHLAVKFKANIILKRLDRIFQTKNNNSSDCIAIGSVLCSLMDILEKNKLLLIMTAEELNNASEPLQSRIAWCLFEVPVMQDAHLLRNTILIHLNNKKIESQEVIENISKKIVRFPHRTIREISRLALQNATERDNNNPVINTSDFEAAFKLLKQNDQLFNKIPWNRENLYKHAVKATTIAGTIGIIYCALSHQ